MAKSTKVDKDRFIQNQLHEVVDEILATLDSLNSYVRYLHPAGIEEVNEAVKPHRERVAHSLEALDAASYPDGLIPIQKQLKQTLLLLDKTFKGMATAAITEQPLAIGLAFDAMNNTVRATEALYTLAYVLPAVSQFFIQPDKRYDPDIMNRLAKADLHQSHIGLKHFDNQRNQRGGFSLYVPEYYNPAIAYPAIIALHGEQGHGATFTWAWLRNARALGAILIAPTSNADTWSVEGRDVDSAHIHECIRQTAKRWHLHKDKIMLTGVSDGGTFCYLNALREDSPVTHMAPFCANFHPTLVEHAGRERVQNLRAFITHGKLDWMFPVENAQQAKSSLLAAGAKEVVYNELEDLSHAYPQIENPKVMSWFLGDESAPQT